MKHSSSILLLLNLFSEEVASVCGVNLHASQSFNICPLNFFVAIKHCMTSGLIIGIICEFKGIAGHGGSFIIVAALLVPVLIRFFNIFWLWIFCS